VEPEGDRRGAEGGGRQLDVRILGGLGGEREGRGAEALAGRRLGDQGAADEAAVRGVGRS
jgi:hypothetical protein